MILYCRITQKLNKKRVAFERQYPNTKQLAEKSKTEQRQECSRFAQQVGRQQMRAQTWRKNILNLKKTTIMF